jgi:hypothetical protein
VRDLPASALYQGEGVEQRVRRLLGPATPTSSLNPGARTALVVIALVVAAASLETVHLIVEAAVHGLP